MLDPVGSHVNSTLPWSKYVDRHMALYIYGFLVFGSAIMLTGRNLLLYKICNNSSTNIHNQMISRILKAPMKFFDANPSGMI
jgi:ATP-binding cassette subfamily C (CFTR/MRP) protein 4